MKKINQLVKVVVKVLQSVQSINYESFYLTKLNIKKINNSLINTVPIDFVKVHTEIKEITRTKYQLKVIQGTATYAGEHIMCLKCMLVKSTLNSRDKGSSGKEEANKKLIITVKELNDFLEYSGDKNTLHQGTKPIIPGILIFAKVCELIPNLSCLKNISIKFSHPIYAEEIINLDIQDKQIRGFNEKVKFTISYTT